MAKLFILFGGAHFQNEWAGGMHDFIASFLSLEEAQAHFFTLPDDKQTWGHIAEVSDGRVKIVSVIVRNIDHASRKSTSEWHNGSLEEGAKIDDEREKAWLEYSRKHNL